MNILNWIALVSLLSAVTNGKSPSSRNKRYLLATTGSQWGVVVALVFPLESNPVTTFSLMFGAQYYPVSNASYFRPLFGDNIISRTRKKRDENYNEDFPIMTRHIAYQSIEVLLDKHGYQGTECMLRAICEATKVHTLHNGLVGDLLHILLSPSTSSEEEEIEDMYYEAEVMGLFEDCTNYVHDCPMDLLQLITYGYFGDAEE